MYETDNIIVPLAEDLQDSSKLNLLKDSKLSFNQIKLLLEDIKVNFTDDTKFQDILRTIHGRFSKIELNLIALEKIKNESVQ